MRLAVSCVMEPSQPHQIARFNAAARALRPALCRGGAFSGHFPGCPASCGLCFVGNLLPPTSMGWKDSVGGDMTVAHIPIAGKDGKTSGTFDFDESSRTLIAAAQIVSDALILSTLSYL